MNIQLVVTRLVLLAGAVLLLAGCGHGSEPPPSGSKTTVLVMRHCVRSTPEGGISDIPGLPYYNNYSNIPWPSFGVEDYFCLPRGIRIVEGSGKWLKQHGDLPMPLQVVADNIERDNVTAHALLSGLAQRHKYSFSISEKPFGAAPGCKKLSSAEFVKAIAAQRKAVAMEETEYSNLITSLASVLQAEGPAANWHQSECALNPSSLALEGSCAAASDFTERFLLEWGGGLKVAWNRLKVEKLPALLKIHAWYRMIMDSTPRIVAREQASIIRAVAEALNGPAGKSGGTRIFVGHDTQLNALSGALGLTWSPGSYPVNATIPGSALRFDSDGDSISVSYLVPANFSHEGDAMGSMKSVPATFFESGTNAVSVQSFQRLVSEGSVPACANNFTFSDSQDDHFVATDVLPNNGIVV
jgi:hypothetical protein